MIIHILEFPSISLLMKENQKEKPQCSEDHSAISISPFQRQRISIIPARLEEQQQFKTKETVVCVFGVCHSISFVYMFLSIPCTKMVLCCSDVDQAD